MAGAARWFIILEQTVVAVLGGDPVIGQALKLLVEHRGYRARFLAEPVPSRLEELKPEIGLLLLAPALSVEGRKTLADAMAGMPEKIPVLELVPEAGAARGGGERTVTWPCGAARLGQAIDAVLLDGSALKTG
ncbi:MAG: hypothetical protein ACRDSJ_18585 [Rubrobacteraceae bacterium]